MAELEFSRDVLGAQIHGFWFGAQEGTFGTPMSIFNLEYKYYQS
jgi:hypothetical protein